MLPKKRVLIIGAGPAGLTAAYELLSQADNFSPLVVESHSQPGGISKTLNFSGFRLDIGGHRFFSKSDAVMEWWFRILPPAGAPAPDDLEREQDLPLFPGGPDPAVEDDVFLIRKRLSRILFERKFYSYPLNLSFETLGNLGILRSVKIGLDYLSSVVKPIRPEKTLEDFLINRFGRSLYKIFFKDYTEKVWGRQCSEIEASWGRQRIKGLSVRKVLLNAIHLKRDGTGIAQKDLETSLINYFLYPKFGPGQLWEKVAGEVERLGGKVMMSTRVDRLILEGNKIVGARIVNVKTGTAARIPVDYCISTAPIRDLVASMEPPLPERETAIALALPYRDFITVGMCLDDAYLGNLRDNWIYVQERDVKVGRLQLFQNWSPYMVPKSDCIWLGLEYFASEGDELWQKGPQEMGVFSTQELLKLGVIKREESVRFSKLVKVKKAYPAYWGSYGRFSELRRCLDKIENLYLVGRNGMHRYNNQDHSMLSAMEAIKNIITGEKTKDNVWKVNSEDAYHEEGRHS